MSLLASPGLECVNASMEPSGVQEEWPGVVGELTESQGDAVEAFKSSVDRCNGVVGCSYSEVGENIGLFEF